MLEKLKNFNNILGEYLWNGTITLAVLTTIVVVITLWLWIVVTFIKDIKILSKK